jgi:hypothetical protein
MAAAKIGLTVEPFESGKVAYAKLAPITAQAKARGRIFLRLDITNNEKSSVTVSSVTVSFPGSSLPAETKSVAKLVGSGKSLRWWFQQPQDDVLFDLPGPSTIKLAFACQGFSAKSQFTYPLAAHVSPVAGGAYVFPAQGGDLDLGEYWGINGCIHAMGAEGSQSFAYDMGVWGPNHDDGSYSAVHPKKDGTKNDHHRVWGKPVRAMADGKVLESLNTCPNNPRPWNGVEDIDTFLADQMNTYWGSFTNGGAGNHFYIQHGDEVVLYAHMQKGTLTSSLLAKGSKVTAGEKLGKAGNSGNSSGPHLHIHAIQGTAPETGPLRPFALKDAWVIDNDLVIQDPRRGLWAKVSKQAVPEGNPVDWWKKDSFLWPDTALPEWPELVHRGVAEKDYQSLVTAMKADGFRPVHIDAYSIALFPFSDGDTFFNVVFRPRTGVTWEARHGLTGSEYQSEYDKWVKDKKYRLVHVESYYSGVRDAVCYAAIFVKSPGPAFAAYHGKTKAEHQSLFDDLTKNGGMVPVNISVVSTSDGRRWTALFEKRNAGAVDAHSTMTLADYQQRFTDNAKKKLYLAYINSYAHEGDLNIVGIWYSAIPSPAVQHHLDGGEFEALMKTNRKANRYLRGVTGYQRGLVANWAGIWNR